MVTADDTGTDWAALADRLDELATDRRWDCWNMHGDGRRIVPEGYDPLPDCCDAADGAYSLRAAAVGLRRLAQLDTAIEQHRTAHVTEGHPGDEPWSCCNDDFYLWAVLGSGEQPEGPTTAEGELCD